MRKTMLSLLLLAGVSMAAQQAPQLPAPFATESANNTPRVVDAPQSRDRPTPTLDPSPQGGGELRKLILSCFPSPLWPLWGGVGVGVGKPLQS